MEPDDREDELEDPGEYTEGPDEVVRDEETEAIPPAAAERAATAEEFGGGVDDEIRVPPEV